MNNGIFWIVSLVLCKCRHGGRAWHFGNIGKCSYPNCNCQKLQPIEATIYPKGNADEFKNISGLDFVKFHNQNLGRFEWN